MAIDIAYDDKKHANSGYMTFADDAVKPLAEADRQRLLHLMWWCVYTKSGRTFLHENWLGPAPANPKPGLVYKTEPQIRDALQQKFAVEFKVVNNALLTALIEGHLAAVQWVNESDSGANPGAANAKYWQQVYQHNLSFIMWALWEDAMGNEFSMAW